MGDYAGDAGGGGLFGGLFFDLDGTVAPLTLIGAPTLDRTVKTGMRLFIVACRRSAAT